MYVDRALAPTMRRTKAVRAREMTSSDQAAMGTRRTTIFNTTLDIRTATAWNVKTLEMGSGRSSGRNGVITDCERHTARHKNQNQALTYAAGMTKQSAHHAEVVRATSVVVSREIESQRSGNTCDISLHDMYTKAQSHSGKGVFAEPMIAHNTSKRKLVINGVKSSRYPPQTSLVLHSWRIVFFGES